MSDQASAPASEDAGLVWMRNPATGRAKQMTREKAAILELSKWTQVDNDEDARPVPAFPTVSSDEVAAEPEPAAPLAGGQEQQQGPRPSRRTRTEES